MASDDFERADENPLSGGGNWTTVSGWTDMKIESGRALGANFGFCGAYWSSAIADDQYSEAVIGEINEFAGLGPLVRVQPGAQSCYYIDATTGSPAIKKIVAGSSTTLTSLTMTIAPGDTIRLEVTGTTLTAKQNGATVGSTTDATFSSGRPGISADFYRLKWDSWAGDALGGGGGTPNPWFYYAQQ